MKPLGSLDCNFFCLPFKAQTLNMQLQQRHARLSQVRVAVHARPLAFPPHRRTFVVIYIGS